MQIFILVKYIQVLLNKMNINNDPDRTAALQTSYMVCSRVCVPMSSL